LPDSDTRFCRREMRRSETSGFVATQKYRAAVGFRHTDPESKDDEGEKKSGVFCPSPIFCLYDEVPNNRTTGSPDITRHPQEGVVSVRRLCRPNIRECTFNQHQAGPSRQPCEESTDGEAGVGMRRGDANVEEPAEEDAGEVDNGAAETLG